MARNFELLQQVEQDDEWLPVSAPPGASRRKARVRLDLRAVGHEESIKLAQRLFLLPGSDAPRMTTFCGVQTGDGTSWVCLRTGEALASQVESSVCLVDANLRMPFLHEHFGTDNLRGLTDAVLESGPIRDFAHQVNGNNLWLLPSGSRLSDSHSLLNSERLRSRLIELKASFDYVLLDGPPVNGYADASLFGKLADGVVLVIRANSTKRKAVKKAKETLECANVRMFGTVLNNRVFPIPESLYRRL